MSVAVPAAQTSRFQAATIRDGLPSNYIFEVGEDENGYMWIGTDKGLGRFDGFRWTVFDADNGLPGNYIPALKCNQRGGIWFLIPSKGIYYFNIKTGRCTFATQVNSINDLQVDENGDLFFLDIPKGEARVRGVLVRHSDPATALTEFTFTPDSLNTAIAADFSKRLLSIFGDTLTSTSNLELSKGAWKVEKKSFLPVQNLIIRKAGTETFHDNKKVFFSKGSTIKSVFSFPFDGYYLEALEEDGGLWLWNLKDGLFWLSADSSLRRYGEKDGLASLIVNDVYRSRRGDLLVSTLGSGLLKMLRPGNARIDTEGKIVKGFSFRENKIYAALENRILNFDVLRTGEIETFFPGDKSLQGINIINDKLLVNSLFGMSEYDLSKNKPVKKSEIKLGSGTSSVIGYQGGYAIGTYGAGIKFKNRSGELKTIPGSHEVSEKLLDADNGFYSLNYDEGAQFFDSAGRMETLTIKNGLPSNHITHLHKYKDTVWVSTRRGISAMHQGRVVLNFTLGKSLQGSHCLYSFHDTTGKFWVVTNRFLHEFVGGRFFKLSVFTLIEGKEDQIHAALYHPGSNMLVTGSANRISVTNLALSVSVRDVPPPRLAMIRIDDKEQDIRKNADLRSDFNKISLSFHPGLTSPFFNTGIHYKLEGLHDDFILLTDSLTVSFSGLRSGKYKMLAKTINSNGRESEVVELATLNVLSPFWQRGWFIAMSTLLAAIILFYLFELYKRNKRLKKRKQRLMDERLSMERVRISKDLHDHLGTSLVTMIAQTENIENHLRNNNIENALDKVRQLSDQSRDTIDVLRETIWAVQENSHTVSEFLLRTRNFLQRIYLPANISWEVNLTGSGQSVLTANQTLQLFRVIQEATQNIIKHAFASKARYDFFENESELRLEITDNGKGIHATPDNGNGLENIRHRISQVKGTVNFHGTNGTTIFIRIPLKESKVL